MRIKKGDTVQILAGKDRGRTGKVAKAMPKDLKVIVEGMNIRKKHVRPRQQREKGQVIEIPGPLPLSSVQLVCSKCGKPSRTGSEITESGKQRVCKKCGKQT